MANPTKPKEAKPRVEGEDLEGGKKPAQGVVAKESNPLVTGIIIAVVVAVGMSAVNYFMMNQMIANISNKIGSISVSADEGEGDEEADEPTVERGVILDLGDFILNLADKDAKHFLKLNVAVELSKKEAEMAPKAAPAPKEGGHGGHGGEEPAPEAPSISSLEKEMNQYKPAIRDAVISILSGKTSDELSTTPGKELAKEQIKESVNSVFDGEREVLRVSFGSFFIQ